MCLMASEAGLPSCVNGPIFHFFLSGSATHYHNVLCDANSPAATKGNILNCLC